jgi:tetratricopeptide (TPR) repeat protein
MITRALSLTLLLAAVAPPVHARPAKVSAQALAQAKAAFKEATAAYDAGRYDDALREFQRAHELSRNPVLYFNLAACAEKLGQPRVAAAHLRAYLTEVPNADDAVKVRERLGALEERAKHDDERRVEEERRAEEEARRKKAEDERRAEAPGATPVAASAPPRPASVGRRYAGGFAMLGVTAAFGVVGAALGGTALANYGTLERECMEGCGAARIDPLRRQAIAADVFYGLTGAAAIATIVLFAVEARRPRERARASAPGGAL